MKIIIWGHPLYSHTHSYINNGFYKAFKHLGYDTYWFDDNNYPADFDWNDCFFFTEGFADSKIPINKTSTYLVHCMPNPAKYVGKVKKLIDCRWCHLVHSDHVYNFTLDKTKAEKLGPCVYYEKAKGTYKLKNDYVDYEIEDYDKVYLTWATDLLPHEFNYDDVYLPRENKIYFCGNLSQTGRCENYSIFEPFIKTCNENNIQFIHNDPFANPLSIEEVITRTKRSILGVDLRGPEHLKNGYVPCRLFKNISYGHIGMTNSFEIYKELDGNCLYNPDPTQLFYYGMENRNDHESIKTAMTYVRENHTFINRIESIMRIV